MRLISYDCEVFAYDWLVTLKDKETGVYTCIWNDNEALKMALSDDCIYVGFNSKHYDQYIIKAIAAGFAPEEIKKVNDFIIAGGQGWQCPLLDGIYFRFSNVDIRDDTQQGLSLKAIEGHLGMSVKESSVPFDIDRPLTPEEKAETEFYCKHDVDTAERLIDIRKDYLKNKINLGRLAGLDEVKAMGIVEKYFPEARETSDKVVVGRDKIYAPVWEEPVVNGRVKLRPVYPRIPDGSRNICLTSLAGMLHNQGYSKSQIYEELLYANTVACDPPLDRNELRTICNSVTRYKR